MEKYGEKCCFLCGKYTSAGSFQKYPLMMRRVFICRDCLKEKK